MIDKRTNNVTVGRGTVVFCPDIMAWILPATRKGSRNGFGNFVREITRDELVATRWAERIDNLIGNAQLERVNR